jgi:uncharacterized protein (DUF2235 family)
MSSVFERGYWLANNSFFGLPNDRSCLRIALLSEVVFHREVIRPTSGVKKILTFRRTSRSGIMNYDDDDTPYAMTEFKGRNILIFSDGTGQAGGLLFDEARSNVYKLFRATRCGPDSIIDPDRQLAFYDPGLGSKLGGERIKIGFVRWVYNVLSSATGLGITENIIDCYSALIQLWRPGDRIFLFGFSRGAYTVRCLGGVLGLCGIPELMPNGSTLLRDPATVRSIALEAVKRVYRHGSGAGVTVTNHPREKARLAARKERLELQRRKLGNQFRDKYHSSKNEGSSNAVPHFIGVWDTVAAVGLSRPAWTATKFGLSILALGAASTFAWLETRSLDLRFAAYFVAVLAAFAILGLATNLSLRLKFVTNLPGHKWYETLHLTGLKMEFFDKSLNRNVRYARHALAIDEYRADFDRVPWENDEDAPNREIAEGAWFTQYWFAGNHSDIGGSYAENESRLSDLSLKWMANQAKKAGLLVNPSYLILFGRPSGPQHDECRVGISFWGMHFRWREHIRKMVANATVHPSVFDRFNGPAVLIYDEEKRYRPELLRLHTLYKQAYLDEENANATKLPDANPKSA